MRNFMEINQRYFCLLFRKCTSTAPQLYENLKLYQASYILQEDSFYGAMRFLLPQLERERDAYGIKEVRQI